MTYISGFNEIKTLIHADFRSENILFSDDSVYTVDWQTVSEGSPLTDVAYFLGGSVNVEDRRTWEKQLVNEYSELLSERSVNLSAEECWQQYREQSMYFRGRLQLSNGPSTFSSSVRSGA
jgi:thiamine kinase-like enzyme